MRVLLTGAAGFLGRHVRVRLRALTQHQVIPVTRAEWSDLADLAEGVDAVIHVAGVNRGTDSAVETGNIELAHDVAEAVWKAGSRPRLVFADSVQADNGTPYGKGKSVAAGVLAEVATTLGAEFVDVRLPNLFGEGARPHYNSFVATFIAAALDDTVAEVVDRPIELLHVQAAAQVLIDALTAGGGVLRPAGLSTSIATLHDLINRQYGAYREGVIPVLQRGLDVDVFNALRSAMFPARYPIALVPHVDARGALVETVRAQGGSGQTFASTTRPGITRGDHFHLSKVERFVVLSGAARIDLRPVFGAEVTSFEVRGDAPVAVDMPTMWVHNITNVGETELTTLFWTNQLHDPAAPDTYWEKVSTGC